MVNVSMLIVMLVFTFCQDLSHGSLIP